MTENGKTILRGQIRKAIRACDRSSLELESESVMYLLERMEQFKAAKVVALYWSLEDEVSTHKFIEKWALEKTILLPSVCGNDIIFKPFTTSENMRKGRFDIAEPLADDRSYDADIDLIVVPGVAFDLQGHRMGRGRGYYDRFLADHSVYKIGVCFSCQLVDRVPSLSHDVAMDKVLCEGGEY